MRLIIVSCAATVWFLAAGCTPSLTPEDSHDLASPPSRTYDLGPPGDMTGVLDVEPSALQTITVTAGQPLPSVVYKATYSGQAIRAAWSVDRGDIGAIPVGPGSSETFTPLGTAAGLVTVEAGFNGQLVKRQVMVLLTGSQNGPTAAEQGQVPTTVGQLTSGGGVGGVGGSGLGPAVTTPAALTALQTPTMNGQTQGLTFLYPYDGTVWPRGLPAPLLMWSWSLGDADAVQIQLATTSGSFTWSGTFGRPTILAQTAGPFINHPIPQDIWAMATQSAGGVTSTGAPDKLTVKVTLAKAGVGYGPITQSWVIAPALLAGVIYYNSYGTLLAQNSTGAVGGNGMFGGAVLSIHVGDSAPKLVAGGTGNDTQCRTCHSVAAFGSTLVVQHGDSYGASSAYALTPTGATEAPLTNGATFPGVYPDGSMALSEAGQLLPLPSDATPLTVSGLSTVATDLGTPAFSPSGTMVAFNPMAAPSLANPTQKLLVMSFDKTSRTFSKQTVVVDDTGKPAATRPGWPAFLPDGNSLVFHHQSAAGNDGNGSGSLYTREGAKAQIAWTSATGTGAVTPLNQLNGVNAAGTAYLPKLATPSTLSCTADNNAQVGNINPDHGDDVDLNYEPTVNPIASGGYVWVVFTSRRMYGNEATIPPFCSDPRGVDLVKNITTKKLWVAAVDVNGKIGTDPSHPAFYLPAQELLAGNSRGFWVLDPCRANGVSCQTGDQCCNGYCEPNGTGGALVCSNTPPNNQCSKVQEKCASAADCCDSTNLCINGFCAQNTLG